MIVVQSGKEDFMARSETPAGCRGNSVNPIKGHGSGGGSTYSSRGDRLGEFLERHMLLRLSEELSNQACRPVNTALGLLQGNLVGRVSGRTLGSVVEDLISGIASHLKGRVFLVIVWSGADQLQVIIDIEKGEIGTCLEDLARITGDPGVPHRARSKGLRGIHDSLFNVRGDIMILVLEPIF